MRRRFMAVGFVRKDSDFPRHGQKLARQLLRGAGQGPRQADDVARTGRGQGYPGLLVGPLPFQRKKEMSVQSPTILRKKGWPNWPASDN